MDTKPTPNPKADPDPKHELDPRPIPRTLGNESTDPFSPAYPPGSLHERLRREEDEENVGGDPTPVEDDPGPPKK